MALVSTSGGSKNIILQHEFQNLLPKRGNNLLYPKHLLVFIHYPPTVKLKNSIHSTGNVLFSSRMTQTRKYDYKVQTMCTKSIEAWFNNVIGRLVGLE